MDTIQSNPQPQHTENMQLAALFDKCRLPVSVQSEQGLVYANPAAQSCMGVAGEHSPLEKKCRSLTSWLIPFGAGTATVTLFSPASQPVEIADRNPPAYIADPSSLKAAEQEADESRAYLQLALEGANIALWDWDISTGRVEVNDKSANLLGYGPNEIRPEYWEWAELVHPEDRERVAAQLKDARLARGVAEYESEHRLYSKSGEWRWVLARGKVAATDSNRRPLRFTGTFVDITAYKTAELALGRSEQRFHAIFDQTFQFIGLLDRNGTLLEVNQTALVFGGLSREEVIDKPFWDAGWWQISTETQDRLRQSVARAARGEFVRYEVNVWGKGQLSTTIDFSLSPLPDPGGDVSLIIAEGRDMMELRRAERLRDAEQELRRLEAVLRSITKGIVIADPSGTVLSMNPAAIRLLGIESEENAKKNLGEYLEFELRTLDGEFVPMDNWPLARILRGETISGYELEVIRLDTGKRFIASFGGAPVSDENGDPILVVQTIRDITAQYETEQALRRSKEELDLALQAGEMSIWRWEPDRPDSFDLDSLVAAVMSSAIPGPVRGTHEAFGAEDRARWIAFGEALKNGEPQEIEYRVQTGQSHAAHDEFKWYASRGQRLVGRHGHLLGFTGVTWDNTKRKRAEGELQRANTSLHELSGDLLRLQDEERRRLARELHDGPVQTLSAAAMNLSVLARSKNILALPHEQEVAADCLKWVKQCWAEMRNMSYLLHPPILDELGLTSALRGWALGFADRTGLNLQLDLAEAGRLNAETETALFRIAQEALGNVHRHSRSTVARVRLECFDDSIVLEVSDKGLGIPQDVIDGHSSVRALGVGIRGMRERARQLGGEITIKSRPGSTIIRVQLPRVQLTTASK